MRGRVLIGVLVGLVLTGCRGGAQPVTGVGVPVFLSGFEGGMKGWEVEGVGPALRVEPDPTVFLTGSKSLKFQADDDSGRAILRVEEPLAVLPGETYVFAFSYRCAPLREGEFPPAPSVRIMVFEPGGSALTSEYRRHAAPPVTDGWGRCVVTFRLGGVPAVVRPEIWLEQESGTIWVDDVVFGPLGGPPSENLLANGGFEEGDAGMPYDWVVFNPSPWRTEDMVTLTHRLGPGGSYQWASTGGRGGGRCLLVERRDATSQEWLRTQQRVSLRGGETYVVSGWVRTEGVEGAVFVAGQLAPSRIDRSAPLEEQVLRSASSQVSGTHDWQKLERTITIPEEAPTYVLILDLVLMGRGKAWFDDISVVHVPAVELVE